MAPPKTQRYHYLSHLLLEERRLWHNAQALRSYHNMKRGDAGRSRAAPRSEAGARAEAGARRPRFPGDARRARTDEERHRSRAHAAEPGAGTYRTPRRARGSGGGGGAAHEGLPRTASTFGLRNTAPGALDVDRSTSMWWAGYAQGK